MAVSHLTPPHTSSHLLTPHTSSHLLIPPHHSGFGFVILQLADVLAVVVPVILRTWTGEALNE